MLKNSTKKSQSRTPQTQKVKVEVEEGINYLSQMSHLHTDKVKVKLLRR